MKYLTAATITVALNLALVGCGSNNKTSPSTSTSTSTSSRHRRQRHRRPARHRARKPTKPSPTTSPRTTLRRPPVIEAIPAPPPPICPCPQVGRWPTKAHRHTAASSWLSPHPADPPKISALVSKLTGDVDPAKIIQYAPGELRICPDTRAPATELRPLSVASRRGRLVAPTCETAISAPSRRRRW